MGLGHPSRSERFAMIAAHDRWRTEDMLREQVLTMLFKSPTRGLQAPVGDKIYYGQAAYDLMARPIVSSAVIDAFGTGTFEPMQRPKQDGP